MKPNLYALLVAINDYHPASRVSSLNGPLNDMVAMQHFLQAKYGDRYTVHIQTLKNEEATRANVITQIIKHLGQAESEDVAFLYYSGHGSFGLTNEAFLQFDPDGREEGMVLYDSRLDGNYDLVDKEVAVLFDYLNRKQPHLVLVADSCHSGSLSRDAETAADVVGWKKRFTSGATATRPLEKYLHDAVLEELIAENPQLAHLHQYYAQQVNSGQNVVIPQPAHVVMSACSEVEVAWEGIDQRGVFTKTLLNVLSSTDAPLSYFEVYTLCQVEIAKSTTRQTPQLETFGRFNPQQSFIDGVQIGKTIARPIYFDKNRAKWMVKIGATYGFPLDLTKPLRFEVYENEEMTEALGGMVVNALGMNDSDGVYMPPAGATRGLDINKTYIGVPNQAFIKPLFIGFEGEADKRQLLENLFAQQPFNALMLTNDEPFVPFEIRLDAADGLYKVYEKGRPIHLLAISEWSDLHLEKLAEYLEHLREWRYTIELQNPRTMLTDKDLQVRFYQWIDGNKHYLDGNAVSVTTTKGSLYEDAPYVHYGVEVHNLSNRPLHCGALFGTENYGIAVIKQSLVLQPQTMAEIIDEGCSHELLVLAHEEEQNIFNYIQLVFSTEQILTISNFELGDLDVQIATNDLMTGRAAISRSANKADWCTRTISLEIKREQPQTIGQQTLELGASGIKLSTQGDFSASVNRLNVPQGAKNVDGLAHLLASFATTEGVGVMGLGDGKTRSVNEPFILELNNIANDEALRQNPLLIQIPKPTDGYIVPVAFDGEFYMPVGELSENEAGNEIEVRISELPEQPKQRSLFKALKMAFVKINFKKPTHDLCWVDYLPNGEVVRRSDGIEDKVKAAKNIMVVIHGIIGDTQDMAKNLAFAQFDKNYLVLTFDYENLNTPIEETAKGLDKALRTAGIRDGHDKNVVIVAHSMGGLVSRTFIETLGGNKLVQKLIMLGTPNGGSVFGNIPSYRSFLSTALGLAMNTLKNFVPWIGGLLSVLNATEKVFITLDQMKASGKFITDLYTHNPPQGVDYYIITGDIRQFVDNPDGFMGRLMDKLLHKAGDLAYGKDTANDIAVSVDGIKRVPENFRPQVADFACHHMNYFVYAPAMEQLKQWI